MTGPRLRKRARYLAAAVLVPALALAVAGLLSGWQTNGDTAPAPSAPALAVSTFPAAQAGGYVMRRIFTGRVEAKRSSALGFERSGLVSEVLVREGDGVRTGQVVARLDRALLIARREEQQAALADAEAGLSLAQATLTRYRESVEQGAVTRQALDEAREGARAAEARVALSRARIPTIDLDIEKSELLAPFDGVVTRRLAHEGRVLPAGEPLLHLQERATPEVRVGVAGPLADVLIPGRQYPLRWRGHEFAARLRALVPVRTTPARTLDALFVPTGDQAALRPGELVELELEEWIREQGAWVPLAALKEGTRGLWQLYTAEPLDVPPPAGLQADHRIASLPVAILYHEGDRAFVRGPFRVEHQVVRAGLQRLVPGQVVRVLPPAADTLAMGDR